MISLTQLPKGLEVSKLQENLFERFLDLSQLPPGLQSLNLSWNKFRSSVDITHLPKSLESLYLNHNQLKGSILLHRLPRKLYTLALRDNHFSGNVHFCFLLDSTMQKSKVELHLECNSLSDYRPKGGIPEDIYYGLQNASSPDHESSKEGHEELSESSNEDSSE